MTPREYDARVETILEDKLWHEVIIRVLSKELDDLEKVYASEVFKASGYKVGQKITDDGGKVWFVSGARVVCNRVVLSLNPPKKDGSMSKIVFIARGEPMIFLN